jgi:hypothetical protein
VTSITCCSLLHRGKHPRHRPFWAYPQVRLLTPCFHTTPPAHESLCHFGAKSEMIWDRLDIAYDLGKLRRKDMQRHEERQEKSTWSPKKNHTHTIDAAVEMTYKSHGQQNTSTRFTCTKRERSSIQRITKHPLSKPSLYLLPS